MSIFQICPKLARMSHMAKKFGFYLQIELLINISVKMKKLKYIKIDPKKQQKQGVPSSSLLSKYSFSSRSQQSSERTCSFSKKNEKNDSFNDINHKIGNLLKVNQGLTTKLSKQIQDSQNLCESEMESQQHGINYETLFQRMMRLDKMIQGHQSEIQDLNSQSVQNQAETRLKKLLEKNDSYSLLLQSQQLEIQNYQRIHQANSQLTEENGELKKKVSELEQWVSQYFDFKSQLENKIAEINEENVQLSSYLEQEAYKQFNSQVGNQKLAEKNKEIKMLKKEIQSLTQNLTIADQENNLVNNLTFEDFTTSFINQNEISKNSSIYTQNKQSNVTQKIKRITQISDNILANIRNIA